MSGGLICLIIRLYEYLFYKSMMLNLSLIEKNLCQILKIFKIRLKRGEHSIYTYTILYIHLGTRVVSLTISDKSSVNGNTVHIDCLPELTLRCLHNIKVLGIVCIGDCKDYGRTKIRR